MSEVAGAGDGATAGQNGNAALSSAPQAALEPPPLPPYAPMAYSGAFQQRLAVGCVQNNPTAHGTVEKNAANVQQLLADAGISRESKLDLLVLPEMALTGYIFADEQAIEPCLETVPDGTASAPEQDGPTLTLARQLAHSLHSYVLVGFPEDARRTRTVTQAPLPSRTPPADRRTLAFVPSDAADKHHGLFNSALLVDRDGALVKVFRKHFLYDDDKRWSQEGPGFEYADLPDLGRVVVGICMDLNMYEFKASFRAWELARFADAVQADILAVPMNWLMPTDEALVLSNPNPEEPSTGAAGEKAEESARSSSPSWSTVEYWAQRCAPLFVPSQILDAEESESEVLLTADAVKYERLRARKVPIFVAANRCGKEQQTTFAGSSSIFRLPRMARPEAVGAQDKQREGVLIATVERPPPSATADGITEATSRAT